MLTLKDGGLYECQYGQRYRVRNLGKDFYCCDLVWSPDGSSYGAQGHLITEIEEYRWVPVPQWIDPKHGEIYRWYRGHWQKRVTRAEAKILYPGHKSREYVLTLEPGRYLLDVINGTAYVTDESGGLYSVTEGR